MGSVIWASYHASVTAEFKWATRVYIGSGHSVTTSSCLRVGWRWSERSDQSRDLRPQTHIKFGCTGLETKRLWQIAGKDIVVPMWLHRISQNRTKKIEKLFCRNAFFCFDFYRISNMSDRQITAQHTVLHTPCIHRVCLLKLSLYVRSQSSALFWALCCAVLRLTPHPCI